VGVTAAVCVTFTFASETVSPSLTARTVTVCAVAQLPPVPRVKVSLSCSPAALLVSTSTAVLSPDSTVIVTSAPGSVSSLTV